MQDLYSDVIQFRGSHYDFGKMQGQLLKDSYILKNRKRQVKLNRPRFSIDVEEIKKVFLEFAPQMWEEFLGYQDSLQWSMKEILMEFGGYQLEYKKSGCSILTGADYLIRNYDYNPKTYEGRYVLFAPTDKGYATIGPSQRSTGRMDGMNEKGLTMGYNFIHRLRAGDGFICNMIGRILLENCGTVEEAINLLKEIPHRHSFTYVLLDDKEVTYVVEASPRGVKVRQSNVCTNHFELLTDENRHHLDDSKRRMKAIKQQESSVSNAYQAFRLLNDEDKGVFSKDYKSWAGTIHTTAYFPKDKRAWIALGGNREPYMFDFNEWLTGANINTKRVLGKVDTDIPFLHMQNNIR